MKLTVTHLPGCLLLLGLAPAALAGAPQDAASAPPKLPPGVSRILYSLAIPSGAEPTADKVALGEKLFNEKRLSVDNSVSCATCHDPKRGFVDGKPVSEGVKGQKGQRNSPTVLNAMFHAAQFWDGRAATLEDQAKLPILNPIEMGFERPEQVVERLKGLPEYAGEFRRVFGREVNYDDLAAAIAAFERTQFSGSAPFDRFMAGDRKAISASAQRGWSLFNGKARCNACHSANEVSPLFSDQKFHNIGVAARSHDFPTLAREALGVVRAGDMDQVDRLALETKFSELGRFLVSRRENEIGAFKTPTLRNIGITGPYMHSGSFNTLWDVMDHYNKGGIANPYLDGGIQRLGLTESEIDDVVAFMFTLTDDRYAALNAKEQARQQASKNKRPERDTDVALGRKGHVGDIAPDSDLKDPATIGVF